MSYLLICGSAQYDQYRALRDLGYQPISLRELLNKMDSMNEREKLAYLSYLEDQRASLMVYVEQQRSYLDESRYVDLHEENLLQRCLSCLHLRGLKKVLVSDPHTEQIRHLTAFNDTEINKINLARQLVIMTLNEIRR